MDPIYLSINRKSKDFQLVHIDVLNRYGIALKFDFSTTNNSFVIKDGKLIVATPTRQDTPPEPEEFTIRIKEKFDGVIDPEEYGFKIGVQTTTDTYHPNRFPSTDLERGENYKITQITGSGIKPEFLIDLHIINKKETVRHFNAAAAADDDEAAVSWGTEFCRFYII